MKKRLITFIVPMMLLCSCGDNGIPFNGVTTKQYEKEVTAEEFSTAQDKTMSDNIFYNGEKEFSFKYSLEGGVKETYIWNENGKQTDEQISQQFYKESFVFDIENKTANKEITLKRKATSSGVRNSGNNLVDMNYNVDYQMGTFPGETNEVLLEIYPKEKIAGETSYDKDEMSLYSFFLSAASKMCGELSDTLGVDLPMSSKSAKYYVDGNVFTLYSYAENEESSPSSYSKLNKSYSFIMQSEFLDNGFNIVASLEQETKKTYLDDHYKEERNTVTKETFYEKFEVSTASSNINPVDLSNYRFDK